MGRFRDPTDAVHFSTTFDSALSGTELWDKTDQIRQIASWIHAAETDWGTLGTRQGQYVDQPGPARGWFQI